MSTHSQSHTRTPGHARPESRGPWIVVTALIAGAVVLGAALMAGSLALLVVGAVLVLAGAVVAVLLARKGAAPLSFAREYPEHTYGPRATVGGDSSPPIDTQPHHPSGPPEYRTLEEVDAADLAEPPDDRRVFPQLSNLGPDERLRNVHGHEVIERAEADGSVHDVDPSGRQG